MAATWSNIRAMKRVAVTGATGFIGTNLVSALSSRGDDVLVFTRDASRATPPPGGRTVEWDPAREGEWYRALDGVDAVVHLAGEQAVGARWNAEVKRRILDSRVVSTEHLVRAIERAEMRPSVFVCASGVGYYGARSPHQALDESAPPGGDFLSEVCVAWERAAQAVEAIGVRVVRARLGIVLGPDGGPLSEMVKPFKAFAGGPIGSGEQVVSWVSLEDAVRILVTCIDDASLSGPVNVVAPGAVTNAELSKQIGQALGRPSWIRVPPFALRARFGEGADPLLTGQRAVPKVLQEHGYVWVHGDLKGALDAALR